MLNIDKMVLGLLEIELESSRKFYEEITQKFGENRRILENRYNEEGVSKESFEDIRDIIVDDYQEEKEFEDLARILVVSHNYFIVEHSLKLLVGNLLKKEGKPLNDKYKRWGIRNAHVFLKSKGIDLTLVEGYEDCHILNLLVNCIKHNGARVSKELARAKNTYKKGEDIKISPDEVDKYSQAIRLFFSNLINDVVNIKT